MFYLSSSLPTLTLPLDFGNSLGGWSQDRATTGPRRRATITFSGALVDDSPAIWRFHHRGISHTSSSAEVGHGSSSLLRSGSARRLHADRAAGRHRHHCHLDRVTGAGGAKGPRSRRTHAVRQQPQTIRPGDPQLPRHPQETAADAPQPRRLSHVVRPDPALHRAGSAVPAVELAGGQLPLLLPPAGGRAAGAGRAVLLPVAARHRRPQRDRKSVV